ncbi:MAG: pre-mRNA cleavage and polyadenylation factor (CPF) complex subunit [Vezdaea aestivalis]|nr:MAG: pre-mRNA cleavage and polyadenylation factor (CPF) complex subunit [Vezdaea aestivalis]
MAYDRDGGGGPYEGSYVRNKGRRPVVDYGAMMVAFARKRRGNGMGRPRVETERPSPSYIVDVLPPRAHPLAPSDSIPAKHLHSSLNKVKHPVNVVRWTPEGRRLLTGSTSGEFTLWNGMGFNFETIMQAHDSAIRALKYSHSGDWLISADQDGVVKYWQPNFNNVKVLQAHGDVIRDLAFSPNDSKFVTASDDATLKVFDFGTGDEISTIGGHNWDVKSVDWNASKGLLVSGSKDHLVKLWDPRNGRCLTTIHGHKNTITMIRFEPNRGELFASAARDQTARVFDLRMMRDVILMKGHDKDIFSLAWHPIHSSLLSLGSWDGSLSHYILDEEHPPEGVDRTISPYDSANPLTHPPHSIHPAHRLPHAHDYAIWSLDWHPLGHILASGSNDKLTRFWGRCRPGDPDPSLDRFHLGEAAAEAKGTWDRARSRRAAQEDEERELLDEADGLVDQKMPAPAAVIPGLPGLVASAPRDGTSTGGAQPLFPAGLPVPPPMLPVPGMPLPPGLPGLDGGPMDPQRLAALISSGAGLPPPPLPPGIGIGMPGAPNGQAPPPFPPEFLKNFPGGVIPPGLIPPPGFPIPPPGMPGLMGTVIGGQDGGAAAGNGAGGRRRAPLPSQAESLATEQRRGKFRHPR